MTFHSRRDMIETSLSRFHGHATARTFAAVSIRSRGITSVTHQRVEFFISGYLRLRSMPPTIFSSRNRLAPDLRRFQRGPAEQIR